MFLKLKNLFKTVPDPPMDESRRRILKGAAGLAALAVVASAGGLRLLQSTENDRLLAAIESGLVVGQTFYFEHPALLQDLKYVKFEGCRFETAPNFKGDCILTLEGCTNIIIANSYFKAPSNTSAIQIKSVHKNRPAKDILITGCHFNFF